MNWNLIIIAALLMHTSSIPVVPPESAALVALPSNVPLITTSDLNYAFNYQSGSMVVESFTDSYEALLVDATPLPVAKPRRLSTEILPAHIAEANLMFVRVEEIVNNGSLWPV